MFIKNQFNEYVRVDNIIAIEVVETSQGSSLNIYTEKSMMSKEALYGDASEAANALLCHMRDRLPIHILHIGNYYLVIEAIDSIMMDTYGVRVKTAHQDIGIVLDDTARKAAEHHLQHYLPVFDF